MAPASLVDSALLTLANAAREQERLAKGERAKAIDIIIDLLFERAAYRQLCREALPYLDPQNDHLYHRIMAVLDA